LSDGQPHSAPPSAPQKAQRIQKLKFRAHLSVNLPPPVFCRRSPFIECNLSPLWQASPGLCDILLCPRGFLFFRPVGRDFCGAEGFFPAWNFDSVLRLAVGNDLVVPWSFLLLSFFSNVSQLVPSWLILLDPWFLGPRRIARRHLLPTLPQTSGSFLE